MCIFGVYLHPRYICLFYVETNVTYVYRSLFNHSLNIIKLKEKFARTAYINMIVGIIIFLRYNNTVYIQCNTIIIVVAQDKEIVIPLLGL